MRRLDAGAAGGGPDGEGSVEASGVALRLVEPGPEHLAEFLALLGELRAAGEHRYADANELAERDAGAYFRRLADHARGVGLPAGYVPYHVYWLAAGRRIAGVSHLRHRLTPALEIEGGHIGYVVRPSERRRGRGTRLLALTLEKARALSLRRVMVTCDTDNVGSAKIIQKNGGRWAGESISPDSGKPVSRYWIELPAR